MIYLQLINTHQKFGIVANNIITYKVSNDVQEHPRIFN